MKNEESWCPFGTIELGSISFFDPSRRDIFIFHYSFFIFHLLAIWPGFLIVFWVWNYSQFML